MKANNVERLGKSIVSRLDEVLRITCVMYRLFHRVKTSDSIEKKLAADPEYGKSKFMQDIIGVRVVLYFVDDVDVVREAFSNIYTERRDDVSIDNLQVHEFSAKRYNIVYDLKDEGECPLKASFGDFVDSTFELQIRTIFSEGWHEVDHDLRYKFKSDWERFNDLERGLNGVLAVLETNEWMMIRIFNELSYGHYKKGNFSEMMRQMLRMRITSYKLEGALEAEVERPEHFKLFQRLDRGKLLRELVRYNFSYPSTLENIIYFSNITQLRIPEILELTPELMVDEVVDAMGTDVNVVSESLALAMSIAQRAHKGQKRRCGRPYISHPKAVADLVEGESLKCVAWLHDALEDHGVDREFLEKSGLKLEIINAVCALTRSDTIGYSEYIDGVCSDALARDVKIADIMHNLSDRPKPEKIDVYISALKTLIEAKHDAHREKEVDLSPKS